MVECKVRRIGVLVRKSVSINLEILMVQVSDQYERHYIKSVKIKIIIGS